MKPRKAIGVAAVLVAVQASFFVVWSVHRASSAAPRPAPTFDRPMTAMTVPSTWPSSGHVRLVHFWATWCAPCRDELPEVLALDPAVTGVDVVAVSVDEADDVVAHFFDGAVPRNVVRLSPDAAAHDFGVDALPVTFVVAADGAVVGVLRGARSWPSVSTRDAVAAALH